MTEPKRKQTGFRLFILHVVRSVLITAWFAQSALAYDSVRLNDALESLTADTLPSWTEKAKNGDAVAQNVVGMAYKYGEVVKQHPARSLYWFLRAAKGGDADAQYNLGRIYGKASGTVYLKQRTASRDDIAAAAWYRKAAEQNYIPAQFNLGEMYAEGSARFARDPAQAFFWLRLAEAGGNQSAGVQVKKITTLLSPAQHMQAEQLLLRWRDKHIQAAASAR